MAEVAWGNAGAAGWIAPNSRMMRFTMPRAGLPVKRLVSAVWLAPSPLSAARCRLLVVASGQSRGPSHLHTDCAQEHGRGQHLWHRQRHPPQSLADSQPAQSVATMPTCQSALVNSSLRNIPRCPPASTPWGIIMSVPCISSQRASATVVAEESTLAPQLFTRANSFAVGNPK